MSINKLAGPDKKLNPEKKEQISEICQFCKKIENVSQKFLKISLEEYNRKFEEITDVLAYLKLSIQEQHYKILSKSLQF